MVILVNDEPIDFTLEGESTFSEVMDGISKWLREEGFVASAIRLNGRAVSAGSGSAPLGDIDRIEVEAVRARDVPREVLSTMNKYLSLLVQALSQRDDSAAREVLAEYRFVRDSLEGFLVEILGEVGREHFGKLDAALASLADAPQPASDVDDAVLGLLDRTIMMCQSRLRELEDPQRELSAVMGLVAGMLDEVRDVPVQLQTGKDSTAMQTVVRFTELIMKMLRLLSAAPRVQDIRIDDVSMDDHIQGLNSVLGELQEAFTAEDSILVGDLLEYEIVDRIESLITAVHEQLENP